jgi:hypothetical protein
VGDVRARGIDGVGASPCYAIRLSVTYFPRHIRGLRAYPRVILVCASGSDCPSWKYSGSTNESFGAGYSYHANWGL